jgi:hypothetical protein
MAEQQQCQQQQQQQRQQQQQQQQQCTIGEVSCSASGRGIVRSFMRGWLTLVINM